MVPAFRSIVTMPPASVVTNGVCTPSDCVVRRTAVGFIGVIGDGATWFGIGTGAVVGCRIWRIRSWRCKSRCLRSRSESVSQSSWRCAGEFAVDSIGTTRVFSKHKSFQWSGGSSLIAIDSMVKKRSSKTTWYCDVMLPIDKFRINGTSLEWILLKQTNIPRCERGSHRRSFCPACSEGSSTYTGHPNVWRSFSRCLRTVLPVNKSAGQRFCACGVLLYTWTAYVTASGRKLLSIPSFQWAEECRSTARAMFDPVRI